MKTEWPVRTIDEIKAPTQGAIAMGPFGSNIKAENYQPSGVPVIRGFNLNAERFYDGDFVFLTEEKADELRNSNAFPQDLVFTAQGTIGQVGIVPANSKYNRFVLSQNLMKATCDLTKVEPSFMYYYFRSVEGQNEILSYANPTGVPSISRPLSSLKSFRFPCPPLPEQRAIAHVLGTLDDKIELNRRMNETLEAMARALFKSWFVDFDPVRAKATGRQPYGMDAETAALFPDSFEDSPLGEVPRGWRAGVLGELCEVTIGGDWGEDSPFQGAVKVVCLRGVDLEKLRSGGYADAPVRWVKKLSLEKRSMDDRDVLIAASGIGPVGRPLWISPSINRVFRHPVIYSNFCKRFRTIALEYAVYVDRVLHMMRESNEIWEYVNGTSIPNLDDTGLLAGYRIVVPKQEVLQAFFRFASLIYSRLYSSESRILATLRDALLPKLLSGEVRVKDAEKFAEKAL